MERGRFRRQAETTDAQLVPTRPAGALGKAPRSVGTCSTDTVCERELSTTLFPKPGSLGAEPLNGFFGPFGPLQKGLAPEREISPGRGYHNPPRPLARNLPALRRGEKKRGVELVPLAGARPLTAPAPPVRPGTHRNSLRSESKLTTAVPARFFRNIDTRAN